MSNDTCPHCRISHTTKVRHVALLLNRDKDRELHTFEGSMSVLELTELKRWYELEYVQKHRQGVQKEVIYGTERTAINCHDMLLHPHCDDVVQDPPPRLYRCVVQREEIIRDGRRSGSD